MHTYFEQRGSRDKSLDHILKLFENLSDKDKDMELDKEFRTKRKTILHIANAIKDKGDRAKHIVFPMNYEQKGPWIIKQDGAKCLVKNRFTGLTCEVSVPRNGELYLDLPHSLLRAKLRVRSTPFCKDLWAIYQAKHGGCSAPAISKKRPFSETNVLATASAKRRIPAKCPAAITDMNFDSTDNAVGGKPSLGGAQVAAGKPSASKSAASSAKSVSSTVGNAPLVAGGPSVEKNFCPHTPYGLG